MVHNDLLTLRKLTLSAKVHILITFLCQYIFSYPVNGSGYLFIYPLFLFLFCFYSNFYPTFKTL